MRQVLLGLGVLALLATSAPVFAQQMPGNFDGTIIGDSRRESEVSRRPDYLTGGARQGICPLVRGASAEVNAYVAARLHQVANDVGARYAGSRCEPNMVVLFSSEPQQLVDEASRKGRFNYRGVTPQRADAFKNSTQPVRWMHGTSTPGMATRDARPYNSLVVVDANKTASMKVSALADYVTMVALADTQTRAAPDHSILDLFDDAGAAPQAMTDADRAYLRSVYRSR